LPAPRSPGSPDIRERVRAILRGEKPDRLPFIDRMELWYSSHVRAGTLPDRFQSVDTDASDSVISVFTVPIPEGTPGMVLGDIHRALGFGQQIQMISHARRLRGVELILKLDGETFYHREDPVIEYFPRLFSDLHRDQPGEQTAEFITPAGTLTTKTVLTPEIIEQGGVPLLTEHPFKDVSDYPAFEHIFEHAEFVPQYDAVADTQSKLGDVGFVAPMLNRIPWQQMALDHVGEVSLFYMIYDEPEMVDKLWNLLHEVMLEDLRHIAEFDWPYIQFDDNLDGFITNPKLFEQYCLPHYQEYTDILHTQGKKVGSHTDGDLKSLLALLADSGLDVAESFSPAPLTECTFDDAWEAWQETGPMIWAGIPSPVLESRTTEDKFRAHIDRLLETVGDKPIIFGVGDMVMPNNSVDRVQYIAERIEEHAL
jgi:hypothetical protein